MQRLGAMTAALDKVAGRMGLAPIFVTLTLPPRWHPNPIKGRRSWTPNLSPRVADDAMRQTWSAFRARLAKRTRRQPFKIDTLGLRVWEPHEDGCSHVHALLYVQPEHIPHVDRHLLAVCPEPADPPRDPETGEPRRVASKLVIIDRERSRGSTYVMKYLRKTVNRAPAADEAGPPPEDGDDHLSGDHFDRTRAWASERRIRRYAVLGAHGVQKIWQRLCKAGDEELQGRPRASRPRRRRWTSTAGRTRWRRWVLSAPRGRSGSASGTRRRRWTRRRARYCR